MNPYNYSSWYYWPILRMRKLRLCEANNFPSNCSGYVGIWRSIIRNEKKLNKCVDKLIMNTKTRRDGYIKHFLSC